MIKMKCSYKNWEGGREGWWEGKLKGWREGETREVSWMEEGKEGE